MIKFRINQKSNQSIFDQVVTAAIKVIVSGELKPGEPFPSIRKLAADLKIHPNTAHKVVQHLIKENWLISVPGKGTIVSKDKKRSEGSRQQIFGREVDHLISEAKRLGVSKKELLRLVDSNWQDADELKAISNDN